MLSFFEALDGTFHLEELGYFSYKFGSENEYELALEPIYGGKFFLALYCQQVLLWHDKLSMAVGYLVPNGPGEEEVARRKAIREYLQTALAQLDEADRGTTEEFTQEESGEQP